MSNCNVNLISTDSIITECEYCKGRDVAENMVVMDGMILHEECEKIVMKQINEYEAI